MRSTTACAIINTAIWVSSAIVIAIALNITKSFHCLWFLLIPTLCGYVTKNEQSQVAGDNSIQIQGHKESEDERWGNADVN